MNLKLQWWHEKDKIWITLDYTQFESLDPRERYRIFGAGMGPPISFTGNQWDKSIMTDIDSLSYWAGYYGISHRDEFSNVGFYKGVLDSKYKEDS